MHSRGSFIMKFTCAEVLESRHMLAGELLEISEFVSSNQYGIRDYYDDSSDWIEVVNKDDSAIDLVGWYLTDDPDNLEEWRVPITTIANPQERLLVIASGRNTVTPGGELHTNFRLGRRGEYLALARPDGTIAWQTSRDVPDQFPDVSYGVTELHVTTPLVTFESPAKFLVPTDGRLGNSWTSKAFDDSAWADANAGIGFVREKPPHLIPGFQVRMVALTAY